MKFLTSIFIILCVGLCVTTAYADTIDINMEWAFNGVSIDGMTFNGFKLTRTNPAGVEEEVLVINGADERVFNGDIEVDEGRSTYNLVATTVEGHDSPKSEGYVFEYIKPNTPGIPAPTVIIRFN